MYTSLLSIAFAPLVLATLLPRETVASSVCDSILKAGPTAPADVNRALAQYPQSDSCHVTLPNSVTAHWSSYISEVKSWLDKNEKKITGCAGYSQFMSNNAANCNSSTTDSAIASGATTSSAGSIETAGGTASTAATSTSTGVAPRKTGGIIAAIAAAGLIIAAL